MSNKIFKYNQEGVAKSIQLGKKGGFVKWDPLQVDGRFEFQNSSGRNAVYVEPRAATDYAGGMLKLDPNTLVTAGYVNSLVEGMRTKRSVQTATETNIDAKYFDPVATDLLWDTTRIALGTLNKLAIRKLFGFAKYEPADGTSETDPQIVELRKVWSVGTRILVKNQTNSWQNGIYVFALDNDVPADARKVYLKRADDMDVEDEVEGSYVYIEQGDFGSTGWVGEVPDSPESILDLTLPKLKQINSTNYTQVNDRALGFTAVTFTQFHGQGTYVGDQDKGIIIDVNKIALAFDKVKTSSGPTQKLITDNGQTVVLVTEVDGKSHYVRRAYHDMLELDFRLHSHKIRANPGDPTSETYEVRVASDGVSPGSAIEFGAPAKTGFNANQTLLRAAADFFTVDYKGNATTAGLGTADKGANITFIAGGTDAQSGAGGDIVLTAGNTSANTGHGGNILLTAGLSGNERDGIVKVSAGALCLPVVSDIGHGLISTDDSKGAIRLNSALDTVTGTDVLEYYNGVEWVQVDGASYFIHDKPQSGETTYDTFISTMGTTVDVATGKVKATHSNTLTFVAHSVQVMSAKEDLVTITPSGSVRIAPVTNTSSTATGDITLVTPVIGGGDTVGGTGKISIKSGNNTANPGTDGSKSGSVEIGTGNHKFNSGDIVITTGDVVAGAGVTSAQVGSVYVNVGQATNPALVGSINVGIPTTTGTHVKNTVNIGDRGYTDSVNIDAKKVSVGTNEKTEDIIVGAKGNSVATSTKTVTLAGNNIEINADDTAGENNGVTITGKNVNVGAKNTTTNIVVGHIGGGATGSTVDIRGDAVTIVAENNLVLKANGKGKNIVFQTDVKDNGGGSFTGGVLTVDDPNYDKACGAQNAIPNVKYVQNMIKDGAYGPGVRTIRVTQATSAAGIRHFAIGTSIPSGAKIMRIALTVSTGFSWGAPGVEAVIKSVNAGQDPLANGDVIVEGNETDIEAVVGVGGQQTYMSEFGAGLDASGKELWIVFDAGKTPQLATQGDISVLVEFVGVPPAV